MQSALEQKAMLLAHELAAQKDSLIKAAIDHCIGKSWTIADIAGRGLIEVQPDKSEVFSFDGRDLIHFNHTGTEVDDSPNGIFMRAVTHYRLLYAQPELLAMSEQNTVFNVNELDECDTGGGPWYENFLARISYDRDNEHRAICVPRNSANPGCQRSTNNSVQRKIMMTETMSIEQYVFWMAALAIPVLLMLIGGDDDRPQLSKSCWSFLKTIIFKRFA